MCKQGLEHNFTKEQKIYIKNWIKKRRKNMQYYFVSKTFFNHHFSKGFFSSTKVRENMYMCIKKIRSSAWKNVMNQTEKSKMWMR